MLLGYAARHFSAFSYIVQWFAFLLFFSKNQTIPLWNVKPYFYSLNKAVWHYDECQTVFLLRR